MQQIKMNFNLPWNTHDNYWICIVLPDSEKLKILESQLKGKIYDDLYFALPASKMWKEDWEGILEVLSLEHLDNAKVAIVPKKMKSPEADDVSAALRTVEEIKTIADNLWLGDAILNNRVECHFQAIFDREGKACGYESFVRARTRNGELMTGAQVIQASHELNIHHVMDRYLHGLAIETYAKNKLNGALFINFITGFIQLPARYLEMLTEAAVFHKMDPKNIVLEVSKSDHVADLEQVVAIVNYCRSKGYSVSLDDVRAVETIHEILAKTTPDYIKIDRGLTQNFERPIVKEKIAEVIRLAHGRGCTVLAEGIESESVYKALFDMGADLFQGYYFAMPVPASELDGKRKFRVVN